MTRTFRAKLMAGFYLAGSAAALVVGPASQAQVTPPTTEWADKTIPIDTFARFPLISQPRMSPDGKWLATRIRANGEQLLAIVPVHPEDGKIQFIARSNEAASDKQDDRQLYGYHWVDSDHLVIVYTARDNIGGGWFDNYRYIGYNRATKVTTGLGTDLGVGQTRELWSSRSGRPHILLERRPYDFSGEMDFSTELINNPEVIDVDLDTGKYSVAMKQNPSVQSWTADADGVVRIGTSSDRETGRVKLYYRGGADQPLKLIFDGVPDRYAGVAVPDIFLAGGKKAYVISRQDGFRALYDYDLATMKLGKKVFGVPGYDIDEDGAATTFDRAGLLGVRYTSDREHWAYFDPRLKEIQAVLEKSFGQGNVMIATTDAKREMILFRVARLGQAESWYLFDTVSGSIGRMTYANDTLKDAVLNPVSVVRYPASDGKQIEAILTMPRHRTGEKKLPLIVLPHGGPWARDEADWDVYGWAQSLAEMGYVVIQPNYRGSTGYGSDWEKASEHSWGYRMQDDLNDAIPWLAQQGIVDPKRVCIFGWSYGGYAASRAAERDGDKYRCAIAGAGVHDLPAMVRYDKNYLGRYGAKAFLGSASNDLIEASPGLHPEKYTIPILIVQGGKDTRVPPSQARDLVARLKKVGKVEGKDFFYVEQPLNTHHLLREADRVQLMQEVAKFLSRFNPA
ncbi:MAG: S9 family peptidase [Sphingomonas sp.]|uniref:alpha/beta hydrolase family protein n=1 Tax=Sphingomonas sp. TaxID=28214 RepID=UPI001AC1FA72|nr:prolyl oligopeptidase family serine peptidase [Sphingomonas sp.]MBN8806678.1 S9 family peptidase [Sphingomonas sp.]